MLFVCRYDWQRLGQLANCDRYGDRKRYKTASNDDNAMPVVICFNSPLIFTNVLQFKKIIRNSANIIDKTVVNDDNKQSDENDAQMKDENENQVIKHRLNI